MLLHDESPAAVEEREKAFLLGTYARTPFHPRSGKGARITDADGREYWDLLGGIAVNVLGHRHPRLIKALRDESNALLHISNLYYHPAQGLLAERLVRASGLCRAFFCNSGTEANEAALKFARLANPGRAGLVALNESFHGRTMGSLAMTGHEAYRAPFEPLRLRSADACSWFCDKLCSKYGRQNGEGVERRSARSLAQIRRCH